MIGMVLAAGASRRLRPDTDALPKALLPVAGETTILDIALRNLAAVGLRDVVVVVGHAASVVSNRAEDMQRRHGVTLHLLYNDRALDWNNAYSLWLAREYFGRGVLLVNGDTVHPVSVEKTLLAAAGAAGQGGPAVILAVDDVKRLAEEEMKVVLDSRRLLARITKQMDPARAYGEYIGATLIDRGRRGTARQRAGGHLAARSRPLLRGWLPGVRGSRRRGRGRPDRRGGMGRGRQPRRPAQGTGDRRPLLISRVVT